MRCCALVQVTHYEDGRRVIEMDKDAYEKLVFILNHAVNVYTMDSTVRRYAEALMGIKPPSNE